MPSVEAVANAFGHPPDEWKGNCTWVVGAVMRNGLLEGALVNGFWRGPVAEGSRERFRPEEVALGRVRHSWIECPDGTICDPTRWVFEDVAPYIFRGPNGGEYLPQSRTATR